MDDPVRVISTVQVGITALGILTGAMAEPLVARAPRRRRCPTWVGFVIAFARRHLPVSVVLGELVPKALTLDRAETARDARRAAGRADRGRAAPVVWVLQRLRAACCCGRSACDEVVAGDSDPHAPTSCARSSTRPRAPA